MRRENGITLIALIITIILLLILVGVSLNLLIKGDLFGSAEKAVSGTNAKVEEQQTRVDDLMGQLDRASIFSEGTVPTLKYKVYGDDIIVYLENSLYDYVSKMSLEDKEKKFVNYWYYYFGYFDDTYYKAVSNSTAEEFIIKTELSPSSTYSSIEELINDIFDGDRKEYEYWLIERTGNYISYEEALNFCLMYTEDVYYQWLYLNFTENVLHVKNNLSVNEKEKRIASITDWSLTQVQVRMQDIANRSGISYSRCLDLFLNMIEVRELSEEEVYQANRVTLTLPTGESGSIYYGLYDDELGPVVPNAYVHTMSIDGPQLRFYSIYYGMYIANVHTSGRYKYTAENYKGTKAEVTVPVELRTANFKVKVSDTETKTYEFIEGQSWGQFVGGEEGYNIMDDNYVFYEDYYNILYEYDIDVSTLNKPYKVASLNMPKLKVAETDPAPYYYICTKQGEELERVILTDAISSAITYELEEILPSPQ